MMRLILARLSGEFDLSPCADARGRSATRVRADATHLRSNRTPAQRRGNITPLSSAALIPAKSFPAKSFLRTIHASNSRRVCRNASSRVNGASNHACQTVGRVHHSTRASFVAREAVSVVADRSALHLPLVIVFLSPWPRGARRNENDTADEIGREHSNQLEINTEVVRISNRALLRRQHFALRRSLCKANVYLFHPGNIETQRYTRAR